MNRLFILSLCLLSSIQVLAVGMKPCSETGTCKTVSFEEHRNTDLAAGEVVYNYNPNIEFGTEPGYWITVQDNKLQLRLSAPSEGQITSTIGLAKFDHTFRLRKDRLFDLNSDEAKFLRQLARERKPLILTGRVHTYEVVFATFTNKILKFCDRGLQYKVELLHAGKTLIPHNTTRSANLDVFIHKNMPESECAKWSRE